MNHDNIGIPAFSSSVLPAFVQTSVMKEVNKPLGSSRRSTSGVSVIGAQLKTSWDMVKTRTSSSEEAFFHLLLLLRDSTLTDLHFIPVQWTIKLQFWQTQTPLHEFSDSFGHDQHPSERFGVHPDQEAGSFQVRVKTWLHIQLPCTPCAFWAAFVPCRRVREISAQQSCCFLLHVFGWIRTRYACDERRRGVCRGPYFSVTPALVGVFKFLLMTQPRRSSFPQAIRNIWVITFLDFCWREQQVAQCSGQTFWKRCTGRAWSAARSVP